MCDHLQSVLHSKPEDLRLYDFSTEDQPDLMEDDDKTIEELGIQNGHKVLVESESRGSHVMVIWCGIVARNKDNSWPEELIAVVKEVEEKEHEEKKTKESMCTSYTLFIHPFLPLSRPSPSR